MTRTSSRGFTLVELLVVIAIMGIFVSLLLPAVQSARESARRASCVNNLVQLIIAVQNYETANRHYPAGTIEPMGPIQNVNQGYHHGWVTQLLPYIEQRAAYNHIDRSVSVYHPNNAPVRNLTIPVLGCSSAGSVSVGYSNYAAVHHDVEAPIDANNNGVFFLNSKVRYLDVSDGASQTLFLGEKLNVQGDLGWLSGSRATLRNTGTSINANQAAAASTSASVPPSEYESVMGGAIPGLPNGDVSSGAADAGPPANDGSIDAGAADIDTDDADPRAESEAEPDATNQLTVSGRQVASTYVGGFESEHPGGANFAFGDGSVRFLTDAIDVRIYQQMGHRADGQLLNQSLLR